MVAKTYVTWNFRHTVWEVWGGEERCGEVRRGVGVWGEEKCVGVWGYTPTYFPHTFLHFPTPLFTFPPNLSPHLPYTLTLLLTSPTLSPTSTHTSPHLSHISLTHVIGQCKVANNSVTKVPRDHRV